MKIEIITREYPDLVGPKSFVIRSWDDPEGFHQQILQYPGKWIDCTSYDAIPAQCRFETNNQGRVF